MQTVEPRLHPPSAPIVKWSEALLRPGSASLYLSMIQELAEYMGESPAVVAAGCKTGAESVAQDWQQRQLHKGSPPAEVLEFYRTTKSYLFDLTTFNAEYPYTATLESLLALARERGFTKFLDFGSGIGSVGLFFARNGMEVALADISEPLRDYAAWRFHVRGLKVTIIDLNREELPKNSFEVVTVFDVLEHLPQPAVTLKSIAASLQVGGLAAMNVTQVDTLYPQHIASYEEVFSSVSAEGFHRLRFSGHNEIFERVQRNPASNLWYWWWGNVWYRFCYRKALRMLEILGLKQRIRKWIRGY